MQVIYRKLHHYNWFFDVRKLIIQISWELRKTLEPPCCNRLPTIEFYS